MAGVIFRHTVEAMVQRVLLRRNLLTPALAQELKALALDPPRPQDVPLAVWQAGLRHISKLVAPGLPDHDALEALGREVLRGYADTLVGKGTLLVAKMLGPRRALLRIGETWATAGDAYRITITEKSPREIEALAEGVGDLAHYYKGVFHESMLLIVPACALQMEPLANGRCRYTFTLS